MPKIDEKELKAQIKQKNFFPAYLIYGQEGYLVRRYTEMLIKAAVPQGMTTFNLHMLEGENAAVDTVHECSETVPLMAERVCVTVKDMNIEALSQTETDKLIQLLSDLPETSVIVFWYPENTSGFGKGKKTQTIIKKITEVGGVLCLDKLAQGSAARLASAAAEKKGRIMSADTANYLVSVVGSDLNTIFNETEKLCFYCEGEITRAAVDEIAARSVEANVFDLVKALTAGRSEKAFQVLDVLFSQKTEPVVILGTIVGSYVDMYRVKAAIASGLTYSAVAESYNYKGREFRLRNAARECASLSAAQIRKCLNILWECDSRLKGSRADGRLVLEEAMVKLLLTTNGEKIC